MPDEASQRRLLRTQVTVVAPGRRNRCKADRVDAEFALD